MARRLRSSPNRAWTISTPGLFGLDPRPPARRAAHARVRGRPVRRVAVLDDRRLGGVDHEPVRPGGEQRRAARGRRHRVAQLPDAPARGVVDELEVVDPAFEQERLGRRGVVQRRVRQRDEPHGVLAQPVVVASGGELLVVVEDRVGLRVQLALPPAGERHDLRQVRGLPVVLGQRHLDALAGLGHALEEVARLGLEGEPGRRVPVRLGHRAHRGQPLQVQQRDADGRDGDERHLLAVREREHGRPGQHAEPQRVLPERRRHEERAHQDAQIQDAAGPQRPAPGREQRDARGADASIGQNAVAVKRSLPPSGNSAHSRTPPLRVGRKIHSALRSAGAPVGDQLRRGAEHQEHARDRAGEHRAQPQHAGDPHPAAAGERPGGDAERDPEQERHPADRDVRQHAGGEQPGGERARGARRRGGLGERREQRGGDQRRAAHRRAPVRRPSPAARTAASSPARDARRTTGRSRPSALAARTATRDTNARPCRRLRAGRSGTPNTPARNPAPAREGARTRAACAPRAYPLAPIPKGARPLRLWASGRCRSRP